MKAHHLLAFILLIACASPEESAKLPTLDLWNEPVKTKLTEFVAAAIVDVPVEERLAVFDFDGTIGCEKPDYMEVIVAMNQLCKEAEKDPTLLSDSLYIAACAYDYDYINKVVYQAILAAFLDYNQSAYRDSVKVATSSLLHPKFKKHYSQLYYAPMYQLIRYLKHYHFTVYFVSGSEEGFLRAYGENYLDMSPKHIIGSSVEVSYYDTLGRSFFKRDSAYLEPLAYGPGKAELIENHIGISPILAFGNTMGDYEMLTYASTSTYPNLSLILVHDDPDEYVYYDSTLIQKAQENNWVEVKMKQDFVKVFEWE